MVEPDRPPYRWDPSLYRGSARYYAAGRIAYPSELADAFAREIGLDGTGRLLDVGCGPGSLTLILAPLVAHAVGIDADADMVSEATQLAKAAGVGNAEFSQLRGEKLPADLGEFDLVTFAQSFHWMDRPRVAAAVRSMLRPGGVCAHVHASTQHGIETDAEDELPYPRPPHDQITALVQHHLGPVRRAGTGLLPTGTPAGESEIYRAAGFGGPHRFEVPGRVVSRTVDQVVAGVYSLSSSTPHLFGPRWAEFDAELRDLLRQAAPDGRFSELTRATAVDVWARDRTTRS